MNQRKKKSSIIIKNNMKIYLMQISIQEKMFIPFLPPNQLLLPFHPLNLPN